MAMTRGETAVEALAGDIRDVVALGLSEAETGAGVARALEGHLARPDLLKPEHCEGNPANYRQHVLHVDGDGSFSIVSLVWLPGQVTPIHDHVCWCVVGVHEGDESEERFEVVDDGDHASLRVVGSGNNPRLSVVALTPPGDIHRVRNAGDAKAISIHVYGANIAELGSSIRRQYHLPVQD